MLTVENILKFKRYCESGICLQHLKQKKKREAFRSTYGVLKASTVVYVLRHHVIKMNGVLAQSLHVGYMVEKMEVGHFSPNSSVLP
jgi:hypothetical protein